MALTLEIRDQDSKIVYLPPQEMALSASALAIGRPNAGLPFTAGGSVSVATGLLLSVFPRLTLTM